MDPKCWMLEEKLVQSVRPDLQIDRFFCALFQSHSHDFPINFSPETVSFFFKKTHTLGLKQISTELDILIDYRLQKADSEAFSVRPNCLFSSLNNVPLFSLALSVWFLSHYLVLSRPSISGSAEFKYGHFV